MKYLLGLIGIVVVCSCSGLAQTDSLPSSTKSAEIQLWGGIALPYLPQEYRTYWKTGYNVGGGFGFSLDPGEIGYGAFYATVDYARATFDQKSYNDSLRLTHPSDSAVGGPVKVVNYMLNFKGTFSSTKKSIAPYFLIGVGYMYFTQAQIVVPTNQSLNVAGINKGGISWTVGVGIEVPISDKARGFIQAKSLLGATDPQRQYFPITAGITYVL